MFYLSPLWLTTAIVLAAFAILYPAALAVLARLRLGVGWRYLGYGALVFFVFEVVLRSLVVSLIDSQLSTQVQASYALLIGSGLALSVGLFEEVGRYSGY